MPEPHGGVGLVNHVGGGREDPDARPRKMIHRVFSRSLGIIPNHSP